MHGISTVSKSFPDVMERCLRKDRSSRVCVLGKTAPGS